MCVRFLIQKYFSRSCCEFPLFRSTKATKASGQFDDELDLVQRDMDNIAFATSKWIVDQCLDFVLMYGTTQQR